MITLRDVEALFVHATNNPSSWSVLQAHPLDEDLPVVASVVPLRFGANIRWKADLKQEQR